MSYDEYENHTITFCQLIDDEVDPRNGGCIIFCRDLIIISGSELKDDDFDDNMEERTPLMCI